MGDEVDFRRYGTFRKAFFTTRHIATAIAQVTVRLPRTIVREALKGECGRRTFRSHRFKSPPSFVYLRDYFVVQVSATVGIEFSSNKGQPNTAERSTSEVRP